MRKLLILLTVATLGFSLTSKALAYDTGTYYEFSTYSGSGSEYDVASYENDIYYGGPTTIYRVTVSVADPSKKDEPKYLSDGVTLNPNYQTRTFSNPTTITLTGSPVTLNSISRGELWVDANYIYRAGDGDYNQVYRFNKNTGAYVGQVVTNTNYSAPRAALLSYGNGKWWMASDYDAPMRKVYSSNGGNWTYEFEWPSMAGSHGDGMEFMGMYLSLI